MSARTIQAVASHRDEVEAAARTIDASVTEDVSPDAIRAGDVLTGIDATVFPFPFTVSSTPMHLGDSYFVRATHGWFGVLSAHHVAHRVA